MPGSSNFNEMYKRRLKEALKNFDTKKFEANLNRELTPEEWYQTIKRHWYFHPTSWYMLQETVDLQPGEHKFTCNGQSGCIPECRFYEPEGRIEPNELQWNIESLEKFVKWKQTPCSPETCQAHPDHHKHKKEEEKKKGDNNNND